MSDKYLRWWDRDLGLGGRVLVKGSDGKMVHRLVHLPKAGSCALNSSR